MLTLSDTYRSANPIETGGTIINMSAVPVMVNNVETDNTQLCT